MTRFWSRYAPYCHLAGWLATMLFIAGMMWGNVSGYEGRITKLELDGQAVKETLAAVRQEVHDLWRDNGHKE